MGESHFGVSSGKKPTFSPNNADLPDTKHLYCPVHADGVTLKTSLLQASIRQNKITVIELIKINVFTGISICIKQFKNNLSETNSRWMGASHFSVSSNETNTLC